jgi:positive regulator of sigma E activity
LKGIWNDLILLPFITAFLDLIENSMILSMILAYPSVLIGFSVLGSLFTILKLSSFILIVGLSLFLLVFTVIKKVRKATVSRLIKKASV